MYVARGSACQVLSLVGLTPTTSPDMVQALAYFAQACGVNFDYFFEWRGTRLACADLEVDFDDWREMSQRLGSSDSGQPHQALPQLSRVSEYLRPFERQPRQLAIMMTAHYLGQGGQSQAQVVAKLLPLCPSILVDQAIEQLKQWGWWQSQRAPSVPSRRQIPVRDCPQSLAHDVEPIRRLLEHCGEQLGLLGYRLDFTIESVPSTALAEEVKFHETSEEHPAVETTGAVTAA